MTGPLKIRIVVGPTGSDKDNRIGKIIRDELQEGAKT